MCIRDRDKEALVKSTAIITPEEEKAMQKPIQWVFLDKEGNKKKEKVRLYSLDDDAHERTHEHTNEHTHTHTQVKIEKLLSRRKKKKVFEYEVKFVNKSMDDNQYMSADTLEIFGWIKRVKELDARIVALEGLRARPLTTANVVKHFENVRSVRTLTHTHEHTHIHTRTQVGLESEFSQHNRIRDLSGGQKVKIVLGACTWAQPHIIILDEPTNYLDRDALGALSNAISSFAGGVLLITHNQEFADSCTFIVRALTLHTHISF